LPDRSIFTATEVQLRYLAQRLRELAFLNKGLLITLTDERPPIQKPASPSKRISSTTAASQSSSSISNRGKQVLHDKRSTWKTTATACIWRIGLQYNDAYSESVFSFANNINTVDGVRIFLDSAPALTRTINYAGQQMGLFKDVKENLTGDDVREGLVAVISVKCPSRVSKGNKGKLNSDIAGTVTQFVNDTAGRVLEQNATEEEDIQQIDAARPRSCTQGARSDTP